MYLVVIDAALSIGATPLVSAWVRAVLGAASSVQGTILVALALVWGRGQIGISRYKSRNSWLNLRQIWRSYLLIGTKILGVNSIDKKKFWPVFGPILGPIFGPILPVSKSLPRPAI